MKPSGGVPPLAALAVLLAVSLLPRLVTLRQGALPSGAMVYFHDEGDEMVFKTLVDQVSKNFFNYSLQGTAILPQLNQQNYDLPIFFHPPAFVYTALLFSFLPLPLVPVLINLGTIALVFFIGRRLYADDRALWAAFLAAVCPVSGGYQTRYLAPAYPALALLAAEPIPRLKTAGLVAVVALIGYGMSNALVYAILETPNLADFQTSTAGIVVRNLSETPQLQ